MKTIETFEYQLNQKLKGTNYFVQRSDPSPSNLFNSRLKLYEYYYLFYIIPIPINIGRFKTADIKLDRKDGELTYTKLNNGFFILDCEVSDEQRKLIEDLTGIETMYYR